MQVLLVEDNPGDAKLIEKYLMDHTIKLVVKKTLSESLQYAKNNRLDIAILDLSLPDSTSSRNTCSSFCSEFPNLPVIIVTGEDNDETGIECISYGAQDYLVKGKFTKELLIKSIHHSIERKEIYTHLAYAESSFNNIVNKTNEGVFVLDQEGLIKFVNPAGATIFGRKPEYLIDEPFGIPVQAHHPVEIDINTRPGGVAELSVTPTKWNNSEAHLVTMRDITENKLLEEERVKTQKLESIGLLAGGIAHDFNNILAIVQGNSHLLKNGIKEGTNADQLMEILENMENGLNRAKDITSQLLTFSKGGSPKKVTIRLDDMIKEAVDFSFHGSNVKCNLEMGENLPSVNVDESQISQVLNNLFINAQQAMKKGGEVNVLVDQVEVSEIYLGKRVKPGTYLQIFISDKGEGISQENLNKVFDPYFSTKKSGSGLGLSSSFSIIKKHDGYIIVQSELGKGTAFTILIPVSETSVKEKRTTAEINDISLSGKRFLIMDDEIMLQKLFIQIIESWRGFAMSANDGDEALSIYKKAKDKNEPFDIVVMDLTIPGGKGGLEATSELLEYDPDALVIVSSGYSSTDIISEYSQHGFKAKIDKPFSLEEMKKVIYNVLTENQ